MMIALEAVDATLAGEPVDPIHAELAELALLLTAERPAMEPEAAAGLDRAVQRRFARAGRAAPGASGASGARGAAPGSPGAPRASSRRVATALRTRWWLWTPATGLAAVLIAAVVIVAAGGSSRPRISNYVSNLSTPSSSHSAPISQPTPPTGAPSEKAPAAAGRSSQSAAIAAAPGTSTSSAASAPGAPFQPVPNGRRTIQAAQLALTAPPSRIELVAQELFAVVGQVRGIVNSSTITATSGPGSYAQFELTIPSSSLSQAMASLSTLRYAKVASLTDTTQDVNDQYQADVRALADARALRTSLLKQLANATTQAQIDSLTARIHDAEASISSDEATLRSLSRQVDYSHVNVTIDGGVVPPPLPAQGSGGGFGLHQAAHDAGRVLTVAAGIALIGAAALVPVALVGGLAWWVAAAVRRRRREHALDLV